MKQWMRKCMAAGFLAAFSTLAAADTIAGLYAGAGVWSAGPGGNIGGTAVDVDALGGYSGNSLQDLSAQVSYAFDSVVDVGVELGYRRFALKLDDDAQTDVSLGGPYVAVALHLSP